MSSILARFRNSSIRIKYLLAVAVLVLTTVSYTHLTLPTIVLV